MPTERYIDMGSNPIIGTSENAVFIGKTVRFCDFVGREWLRTKTHENTVYSPQVPKSKEL